MLLMLLFLSGCGGTVRVGFISNPGSASVNGTVSIVRVSVVGGENGTSVTVTAVTLIGGGTASDIVFCGDHRDQFPINHLVTASYMPGTTCSTVISVKGP